MSIWSRQPYSGYTWFTNVRGLDRERGAVVPEHDGIKVNDVSA